MMGNHDKHQRRDKRDFKSKDHRSSKPYTPFKIEPDKTTDYDYLVKKAEEFGKRLTDKRVKRSQFRRIFTHIKNIQTNVAGNKDLEQDAAIPKDILKEVLLLKPKMAYTAGRHENIKEFYKVVVEFVNGMKTVAQFNCFYDFVEATLAYHRYHGGRD